jgi:hypothetical protein
MDMGAWLLRSLFVVAIAACGAAVTGPPPEPVVKAKTAWRVPDGFRGETIPFPLDFAPSLSHRGAEELRFAPGVFDPAAPGYWSYAFAWRTDDAAALDAAALAGELTAYFRGLIDAVDTAKQITDREAIVVTATPAGGDGARLRPSSRSISPAGPRARRAAPARCGGSCSRRRTARSGRSSTRSLRKPRAISPCPPPPPPSR